MALQLWETLNEAITVPYTATFVTVLALLCAIYYVLTGPFASPRDPRLQRTAPEEQMEKLPPSVQARVSEITTKEELEQSDGSESDGVAQSSSEVFTASSSSSPHHPRYQVFLSFRGKDTRLNFTGHLWEALKRHKIKVFYDENELEKGEELSPTLLNAIKASKVSIIILSEDYASSNSCLTELSEIMECKTQGQIVLPIFYQVDPSDVRHHMKSFKQSFDQHLKEKREKVEVWKTAFTQVGYLKGWHIHKSSDRSEAEYVKDIVKVVIEKLRSKATYKSEELVGTDDQIERILLLLEKEDICAIGIWGMGGIGKTTLAEAVYNELRSRSNKSDAHKFDAHYFLHMGEGSETNRSQSQSLRRKLLSQLLGEDINIDTPSIGCTLIKDRLQRLKVLLVLDDVDNSDQIEHLGFKFFGPGSKIIVTSRDRQVLLNIKVDICHQVNVLSEDNSLQLFCKHAFKQYNPVAGFQDLAMKFVEYAGGIPLALKVLGAALLGMSRDEWKGAWEKREEYPEERIFGPLKISYYGLGGLEKNIFLDIACFHNGRWKYVVEEILLRSYKGAKFGIRNLVNKCLIDNDRYPFRMHDLLRKMGRDIVRQESEDPGRRSRLWSPSDVCDVLQNNKGTESIKGIFLNMDAITEVGISGYAFKGMDKLKVIRFDGRNKLLLPNKKLEDLPNEITYFYWYDCPLKSLPPKFSPKFLVELSLPFSNIKRLWSGDEDFANLKVLNVRWCKNLRKIPSLSRATKLEKLECVGCKNLVELPCMTHLTSLKDLWIHHCPIKKFPEIPTNGVLTILDLSGTRIKEVPSLHLTPLRSLYLNGCPITKFPEIPTNGVLEALFIGGTQIKEVPLLHLTSLRSLYLNGCPITKFPEISTNGVLKGLVLSGTQIKEVPSFHLASLKYLNLSGCPITKFSEIPTNGVLQELDLGGTQIKEVPLLHLTSLRWLNLNDCANLVELNFNTTPIKGMRWLDVRNCKSLKSLLGLPRVATLSAGNCTSLERVSFIDTDPGYGCQSFDFSNCSKLSPDIIAVHPLIRSPSKTKRFVKRMEEDELDDFPTYWNNEIGVICYLPRSEILKKFENQNRNSWITVKLGSTAGSIASTRFLCFALCLVLDNDSDDLPPIISWKDNIECKYQLKGGINGDKNFRLAFQSYAPMYNDNGSGQHLYLLFGEEMVHRDMQYTEASFAFRLFSNYRKVEKCGVHVFYVDAESFTVSHAVSSIDGQDIDEEHVDFT